MIKIAEHFEVLYCFKNVKDFYARKPLAFRGVQVNDNPDYTQFHDDYARGVCEGLRIKYARPVVAVWRNLNGKPTLWDVFGR